MIINNDWLIIGIFLWFSRIFYRESPFSRPSIDKSLVYQQVCLECQDVCSAITNITTFSTTSRAVNTISYRKSWNFLGLGVLGGHFYYTNPKRKKPIKLLKVLFKYNFTITFAKHAIIILVFFLWFFYDFLMMFLLNRLVFSYDFPPMIFL